MWYGSGNELGIPVEACCQRSKRKRMDPNSNTAWNHNRESLDPGDGCLLLYESVSSLRPLLITITARLSIKWSNHTSNNISMETVTKQMAFPCYAQHGSRLCVQQWSHLPSPAYLQLGFCASIPFLVFDSWMFSPLVIGITNILYMAFTYTTILCVYLYYTVGLEFSAVSCFSVILREYFANFIFAVMMLANQNVRIG